MFPLLETIKVSEHGPENLPNHQQRMDASYAEFYGGMNPFYLESICKNLHAQTGKLIKCRILYGAKNYQMQTSDYHPAKLQRLKLVHADSLDYHLKYAERSELNKLLEQKAGCDDILIVRNGLITDTSYANIAFLRNGQWITPATPLLKGTKRQLLLDGQIITEGNISLQELALFECFRVFNSMLDFQEQQSLDIENIRE